MRVACRRLAWPQGMAWHMRERAHKLLESSVHSIYIGGCTRTRQRARGGFLLGVCGTHLGPEL